MRNDEIKISIMRDRVALHSLIGFDEIFSDLHDSVNVEFAKGEKIRVKDSKYIIEEVRFSIYKTLRLIQIYVYV